MARHKSRVNDSAHLRRLKSRFQAWRKTRVRGERIPEPLWKAAAKVAADVGVCRAASVLKLDYYALQRRMQTHQRDKEPAISFVELPSTSFVASCECVIEIEDGAGASMRMQIKGADLTDIALLGRRLWREE